MTKKHRIVFMGTPDFSVPTLEALLAQENLDVVAVVTAVDKVGGRGQNQVIRSAVKTAADNYQLPILQPLKLKDPAFIETFQSLLPDLAVVVAFRMLPEVIWSIPKFGTINLHASLLPCYRGAAPINWAIINGEKETGLTTFLIAKEIDTGGILFQERIPISEQDDAGSLHDKMMVLGAPLVVKTVNALLTGIAGLKPQDDSLCTKAPKIFTEDCEIKRDLTTMEIYNFIRGLSPYPGAWLKLDDLTVKIYKSSYQQVSHQIPSGTLISDGKKELVLFTTDGYLEILELQMPGKRRMDIKSFLNGYDVTKSDQIILKVS
ncbi:MAG: methionyl-tRNA formyltransferase [Saprospiraceae bacterium]|nr:methionyl-tRNA formyltransferase [Saprospiraceae bacterium]